MKKRKRQISEAEREFLDLALSLKERISELKGQNASLTNTLYDMSREIEDLRAQQITQGTKVLMREVESVVIKVFVDVKTTYLTAWTRTFTYKFEYSSEELSVSFPFSSLVSSESQWALNWEKMKTYTSSTFILDMVLLGKRNKRIECSVEIEREKDVIVIHIRPYRNSQKRGEIREEASLPPCDSYPSLPSSSRLLFPTPSSSPPSSRFHSHSHSYSSYPLMDMDINEAYHKRNERDMRGGRERETMQKRVKSVHMERSSFSSSSPSTASPLFHLQILTQSKLTEISEAAKAAERALRGVSVSEPVSDKSSGNTLTNSANIPSEVSSSSLASSSSLSVLSSSPTSS